MECPCGSSSVRLACTIRIDTNQPANVLSNVCGWRVAEPPPRPQALPHCHSHGVSSLKYSLTSPPPCRPVSPHHTTPRQTTQTDDAIQRSCISFCSPKSSGIFNFGFSFLSFFSCSHFIFYKSLFPLKHFCGTINQNAKRERKEKRAQKKTGQEKSLQ